MINRRKSNKGFTLVELLVVIAIIGILAVVAVPALFKNINKAKVADLESDYNSIKSATLAYYTDKNELPKNLSSDLFEHMDSVPSKSSLGEGTYSLSEEKLGTPIPIKSSLYLCIGDRKLKADSDKDNVCDTHKANISNCIDEQCYVKGSGITLTEDQSKKIVNDIGSGMVYIGKDGKTPTVANGTEKGDNLVVKIKLIDGIN